MRGRLAVLSAVLLLACVVGYSGAATNSSPARSQPATVVSVDQVIDSTLTPDAFFGLSDISSTKETHMACICAYGINCCGDLPEEYKCGLNGACVCNGAYQCRKPHYPH